jgi:hypothetical protein
MGAYRSPSGPGIALLLYSMTLTRGIAMVVRDADFQTPLIAANGYCSQELVNLLLVGRAHSNVFDGEQTVGGEAAGLSGVAEPGSEQGCRLRGIPRKALVGFLTLFEKQGGGGHELLIVGSHYKRPLLPIFVVQSESHYSCLWAAEAGHAPVPDVLADPADRLAGDPEPSFGADADDADDPPPQLPDGATFDLYYFDQMAERNDAVRLTVRGGGGGGDAGHAAPLELVILSRWPAATIDWNGEEVIL